MVAVNISLTVITSIPKIGTSKNNIGKIIKGDNKINKNIPKIKRERPDLIIFEDAAEGLLGKYGGEPVGSSGIASSLSFK